MVLNSSEKQGGRAPSPNITSLFYNTLNNCDLMDLGYHGDKFTWVNNQENEGHIKERLDRFCASPSWTTKFPRYTNYHLLNYSSDHNPILLVFGSNHDFRDDSHSKKHIKRFENIWLKDPRCLQVVKEEWSKATGTTNNKLQQMFDKVYNWGRETFGNIPRQITSTQAKLQDLKTSTPSRETINQIKQLESKLDGLLYHEEQWWAQRAKVNWLHLGDKNSKFFHFKASQRNRKNKINFIKDNQGSTMTQNIDIQAAFLEYFTNLFTSSNPTNIQETINVVANRITPQMYDYLDQDFTAAEVSCAIHQLKGTAAPGPDGLNASFYQAYWETIGGDITQSVLHILNNGGNPDPYNNTYICLIPKHKHPTTPADFRPIALCNVFLKIITKTIANRIKGILPDVISPQQSAFLPDDSLIFCKADRDEACHLMTVFEEYQRVSGQKINMEKSEMTFSPNIYQHIKDDFQEVMPLQVSNNIAKYLGMPTHIGRSKQEVFNFIMDKVRNKLKGWKEKHLSFAGRGVLISAVIQAIPTYIMSCFMIPKQMCDQIEKSICRFWWGNKESNHRIHWKARKDLFKSKFDGGMGFRNMHWFNLAMLAKQVWRLQTDPTSLLGKCLKARYYPTNDILHSQQGNHASYAWQSIHQAIWVIKKGSCWKIGDGQNVHLWDDNWVVFQNGYKLLTPPNDHDNITKVRDIMLFQPTKDWNYNLIDQTFLPFERDLIKQIPLITEATEDQLMWPHTKEGDYSVKSGYNL
ncbi:hypothetical protein A2U01_0001405, partial [Trifolium medium]|nr:hypothetical protein [Trifolium medium]